MKEIKETWDVMEEDELCGHEEVKIPMKQIVVDRKMVKFVNWINSFESAQTVFCCQGMNEEDANNEEAIEYFTYVTFICTEERDLRVILGCIDSYGFEEDVSYGLLPNINQRSVTCEVHYHGDRKRIEYTVRFPYDQYPDIVVQYYQKRYKKKLKKEFDKLP